VSQFFGVRIETVQLEKGLPADFELKQAVSPLTSESQVRRL
jgi:hypothetical protein